MKHEDHKTPHQTERAAPEAKTPKGVKLVWVGGDIKIEGLPCHDLTAEDMRKFGVSEAALLNSDVGGVLLWAKA